MVKGNQSMRIAAFCAATGLSRDTVRFYEKAGLLRPRVGPSGTNRYREFDAEMVERAAGIQRAKAMGFSLREIGRLIEAYDRDMLDTVAQITWLREKVAEVDLRLRAATEMRRALMDKITRLESQARANAPASRARRVTPPTERPAPRRRAAP